MTRTPRDIPDAELAVLQALWERGPSDRGQLADILYPGQGPARYTTVQKLLERLQSKGYVETLPGLERRTFAATVTRDELISRRLLDMADKLCEGSLTPLLTNLVRAQSLTARQLQELRDGLDQMIRQQSPRGKGR